MSEDCPLPHDAAVPGFCPRCGLEIEADPHCAACGEPRRAGPFCEACGHRHDGDPGPARRTGRWVAVVTATAGGPGTARAREQRVELAGRWVRIGRRSRRDPDDDVPDIDLTGPPVDPGVSRRHARLIWQDTCWFLVDTGSANGTFVNGSPDPLVPHELVALTHGDRIGVGLWTLITITCAGGPRANGWLP